MDQQYALMNGLIWYLAFLFSTVCHEASHAWCANRLGDATARQYISLNPLPHIQRTPFGMVVIPLLVFFLSGGAYTFGYASVPINTFWAVSHPRQYALVSLAGPLANILIASCAFTVLALVLSLTGMNLDDAFNGPLNSLPAAGIHVLDVLFFLNLILAAFNLLPLPPLDGSQVPALFLPRHTLRSYLTIVWNPSFSLPGILMAYLMFPQVFRFLVVPVIIFMHDILANISG